MSIRAREVKVLGNLINVGLSEKEKEGEPCKWGELMLHGFDVKGGGEK